MRPMDSKSNLEYFLNCYADNIKKKFQVSIIYFLLHLLSYCILTKKNIKFLETLIFIFAVYKI